MRYEEALELAGSIGHYQWMVVFFTYLYTFTVAFNNMSIVYLGAKPDHWCRVPDVEHLNLSVSQIRELTIPKEERDGEIHYSQCQVYVCDNWIEKLKQSERNVSDYTDCDVTFCQHGWIYDRSEYASTIVTEWDLVCHRRPLEAMSQSMYMAGLMVGVLGSGLFADWLGRKPTMIIGLLLVCAFSIGAAFSNSLLTFIIQRFIVAAGSIACNTTSYVLGIEYVGPSSRTAVAVLGAYFWTGGILIIAALAYAIRDWRYFALSFAAPQLLLFIPFFFMPESPRWLYSKKKNERGVVILRNIARHNGKTLPENLEIESDTPTQKSYPWDFFRYPQMRIRTLVMYFNWGVVSMVYYGLFLDPASIGGNERLNFFIYTIIEIPSFIVSHLTLDRFGRRFLLCFSMILGGTSLMCTLAVMGNEKLLVAKIVLTMIGKWAMNLSFVAVYVFSAEIFPTTMRNNGVGSSSFCARIGGIIAPQIALLGSYNRIIPPIVFGSLALLAGLTAFALPETAKRELPETIIDAERFGRSCPVGSVEPVSPQINGKDRNTEKKLNDNITTHM